MGQRGLTAPLRTFRLPAARGKASGKQSPSRARTTIANSSFSKLDSTEVTPSPGQGIAPGIASSLEPLTPPVVCLRLTRCSRGASASYQGKSVPSGLVGYMSTDEVVMKGARLTIGDFHSHVLVGDDNCSHARRDDRSSHMGREGAPCIMEPFKAST